MAVSARALRAGRAVIELSLQKGNIEKQLQAIQVRVAKIGSVMSSVGVAGLRMSAMLAAPLAATLKFASDASEGLNKFQAIFGTQADAAEAYATRVAAAVGRSKTEIRDALASFQGMFVGLGFDPAKARELSQQIHSLALDFASFHNLSDEEAVGRFISALSGSSEVLDKFGVNIRVAALEQEALAQGLKKSSTEMSEAEKVSLRLSVITKALGSQGAIGDAEKTAGSFANQLKALRAQVVDVGVEIGTTLLPVATKWLGNIRELANALASWVSKNSSLFASLAQTVVKVAAGSIALIAFGKVIGGVATAVKGLQLAIMVLTAHPLIAVAAITGTVALAFMKWAGWLDQVHSRFSQLTGSIPGMTKEVEGLTDAINKQGAAVGKLTLEEKIAAKEKEIREMAGFSKTLPRLKAELAAMQASQAAFAAGQAPPPAPPADATKGKDPLGFEYLSKAEESIRKLWADFKATAAGFTMEARIQAERDMGFEELRKRLIDAAGFGMQTANDVRTRGGTPTAFFDTRLAQMMTGGGDKVQQEQLKYQKQIAKNTARRGGGLPVV